MPNQSTCRVWPIFSDFFLQKTKQISINIPESKLEFAPSTTNIFETIVEDGCSLRLFVTTAGCLASPVPSTGRVVSLRSEDTADCSAAHEYDQEAPSAI